MTTLTPELRMEIEKILSSAGNDNRHAMAFRGLNEGLRTKELARQWDKSPSYVSMVVRSLRLLLADEVPDRPSIALTNSFGYRELLDFQPSADLREYVLDRLRLLQDRNPRVRVEPMGHSVYADRAMLPGLRKAASFCTMCFLMLPCDCE